MHDEDELEYKRPQHANPTRHLRLSNAGPGVGISAEESKQLLRDFKPTRVSILNEEICHVFASFETEQDAEACLAALQGKPVKGRVLSIKFADVRKPKGPAPVTRPAAVMDAEACGIPGLELYKNYVNVYEEEMLVQFVDSQPWNSLAKRRVQHYGFTFSYETRGVDPSEKLALPEEFKPLLDQIEALLPGYKANQITVNEYESGVGLSPHVDTHSAFEGPILSLSLAGPAVMVFRREGKGKCLALPPRSLLIMSDEARLAWQHYIPHSRSDAVHEVGSVARASRRVSITLRQVRWPSGPCACTFPEQCDSQQGELPPTRRLLERKEEERRNREEAQNAPVGAGSAVEAASTLESSPVELTPAFEERHVNNVYNAIAPHFSATRFAIWPKVRAFIDSLPGGCVVADVGCGNGKYLGVRRDLHVVGLDQSEGLVGQAARRLKSYAAQHALPPAPEPWLQRADVAAADGLRLPLRSGALGGALCIAVLHHMTTEVRRVALLSELARILRPGGKALVTAWATQQERMDKLAKWHMLKEGVEADGQGTHVCGGDYLVPWHVPWHRVAAASAQQQAAQQATPCVVDQHKATLMFQRYYHLFAPGELERLAGQVDGLSVADCFYDKDNWCIVIEKVG